MKQLCVLVWAFNVEYLCELWVCGVGVSRWCGCRSIVSVVNIVLWVWAVDVEVGVGCWYMDVIWVRVVGVYSTCSLAICKCLYLQ